ncbi:MAG: TVP38/TMEM64 family protein [Planctomycetaceae bacterium]
MRTSHLPWLVLIAILLTMLASWCSDGIVARLLDTQLSASERVLVFQHFFHEAGFFAPLAYVMFVVAEVIVAPIPGLMLYAPGGLIFGPWLGGFLAVIGNTIGAGISCAFARNVGQGWLEKISANTSMEKLQEQLNRRGFWMILLLRLNPLTSSDLLSYAAGLTRIPIWHVMLATGLGMAPLCFAQSWLSDGIFNRWPGLIWPLMISGLMYLAAVAIILSRMLKSPTATVVKSEAARTGR